MITLNDYLMNRQYNFILPPIVFDNAKQLLSLVNPFLETVPFPLEKHPNGFGIVSSGWRPPELNAVTAGAAPKSKHMIGAAVDIYDPEGELDNYITDDMLEKFGLYREHPTQTKGWCHLTFIAPKSGKRSFYV